MRRFAKLVATFAWLVVTPAAAYAQATITGVVRDTSGAVMPGVTVEVTSPALIEKVRSATTDGTGQYRIIALPPGTYGITFTLENFSAVRREGVELTGSFTATVNADLRVGSLTEAITVTGETPLVDIQSTTQQRVMTHDVIDAVPNGRLPSSVAVLIPGISIAQGAGNWYGLGAHDVGGAVGDMVVTMAIHGGQTTDSRMSLNGLSTGWGNEGFETGYTPNMSAIQEVTVDTAAVSAEAAEGGVRTNIIPRDGGNSYSGTIFGSFAHENLTANNLTTDLRDRGLAHANSVRLNGDFNPGFGGPIKQNRLWFYTAARYLRADNYVGGVFVDTTEDDPSVWRYSPHATQRAINNGTWKDAQVRLTGQASPKHKVAFSWSQQTSCKCPSLISATQVGGTENRWGHPQRIVTADWAAPLTNRLLFEASVLHQLNKWGFYERRTASPLLIGFLEQANGMNVKTRPGDYRDARNETLRYRAAVSYVTGAHAFKVGFNNATASADYNNYALQPIRYRLNNGVPNQITLRVRPYHDLWEMDAEVGLYAQDKWTVDRLTVSAGMRYDYRKSHFPLQHLGPTALMPIPLTIPETPQLAWHDITPKMGAAYDLFGAGKTALKVSLNKYLTGKQVDGLGNPVANLVLETTRAWTDADGDFFPDCDLIDPLINGECRQMANPNFGKVVPGTTYDPKTLRGWGAREYNWEFSTSVQHEILPRVSVDVGYFRRWYGNLTTTDNRALTPADFDPFSIMAPAHRDLPDGGGYAISGFYNVKPEKFSVPTDNYVTFSDPYGKLIQHWNGVDVTVNVRASQRLLVQGGLSTGRTSTDTCEMVAKLPELFQGTPASLFQVLPATAAQYPVQYCHVDTPFLTQVKFLSSYTIPRVDVQVSGTFQSIPGPQIVANYVAGNPIVSPSLGRNLAGGETNITLNLVKPGTLYGERLNQLDLRVGKILRFGRTRATVNLDLYNALNGNAVLQQSNTFGNWQQPQGILVARFAKMGVQLDF